MTVTASVDLTEEQSAYAASLVEAGDFPSIEAVVGHSLDVMREEAERKQYHGMTLKEFRAFLDERRKGPFISMEEFDREAERRMAERRRAHGLPG